MGLKLFVEDLSWSFAPGVPTLRVPRLVVEPGQLAALSGPSGAGKSTLLYLLAGLDLPQGRILWDSFEHARARPAERDRWRRTHLGLVFQDFQLVPDLSALDNVLLPVTFTRFTVPREARLRAAALLNRLCIARTRGRTATLSRGEMQRVALARALLHRPPVVLADEPTASLDAVHEAAVVETLRDYSREGHTVLVATHQPALRDAAARRFVLDHGLLEEA